VAAEESGGSHRAVWASAPGSDRVAFAVPDNGTLMFRFSAGEQAYQKLISSPGVDCEWCYDRSTCRFLSARFHHRRQS
jgi:hypothetical protein